MPLFGLGVAKPADRATENPRVGGSIPPLATILHFLEAHRFSGITRGPSVRARSRY